jgi:hypothetical protein
MQFFFVGFFSQNNGLASGNCNLPFIIQQFNRALKLREKITLGLEVNACCCTRM